MLCPFFVAERLSYGSTEHGQLNFKNARHQSKKRLSPYINHVDWRHNPCRVYSKLIHYSFWNYKNPYEADNLKQKRTHDFFWKITTYVLTDKKYI